MSIDELKDALIQYRAEHRLTQTEFGKLVGLTTQTIAAVEAGRKNLRPTTYWRIVQKITENDG